MTQYSMVRQATGTTRLPLQSLAVDGWQEIGVVGIQIRLREGQPDMVCRPPLLNPVLRIEVPLGRAEIRAQIAAATGWMCEIGQWRSGGDGLPGDVAGLFGLRFEVRQS